MREPVQQRIMCSINSLIAYFNITMANKYNNETYTMHIVVLFASLKESFAVGEEKKALLNIFFPTL